MARQAIKTRSAARPTRAHRQAEGNVGLVRQLLIDARSGYYQGCDVRITSRSESGKRYEVVGPVDRVDFRKKKIYIEEAQAIEGVSFSRIISYMWLAKAG